MPITCCIFDAYGTLFDVAAAARDLSATGRFPALSENWPALAEHWRIKQLSYSWLRAVSGDHADFWQVTGEALDWSLEATGLDGDAEMRAALMALYHELASFPEVPEMLATLKGRGQRLGILSNGSPAMLEGAVGSAGIGDLLEAVLSVESVGVFKPARAVYDLVGQAYGVPKEEVLFVSSNGWDAAAGAAYGFTTAWVNRKGEPLDRLPGRPHHILSDLATLPDLEVF